MVEYYFDIETTGRNLIRDEIITIQWQPLHSSTGEAIGNLTILKSWESSEREILESFLPSLQAPPFQFICVSDNLMFEFAFLHQRLKHHQLYNLDFSFLYEQFHINLKPVLVLINQSARGFTQLIPKTNPISNITIPQLYREQQYDQIIQYIRDEAEDFIKAYNLLKINLPQFKKHLKAL